MVNFEADLNTTTLARIFEKEIPANFREAVYQFLNAQAFDFKTAAPDVLSERYEIRDRRFVNSRFRVEKAKLGPVNSMRATAGPVLDAKHPSFSGWVELLGETNQNTRRHTPTLAARGGNKGSKVKKRFRLDPALKFKGTDDFTHIPEKTRAAVTIRHFWENREEIEATNGLFKITGGGWIDGIYRFTGRLRPWNGKRVPDVELVQLIGMDAKEQTRKFNWAKEAIKRVKKKFSPQNPKIREIIKSIIFERARRN
jgi:hypothetical protein